jgi:hypothetical protein
MRLGNLAQRLETVSGAEASQLAAELRPVRDRTWDALVAETRSPVGS